MANAPSVRAMTLALIRDAEAILATTEPENQIPNVDKAASIKRLIGHLKEKARGIETACDVTLEFAKERRELAA